MKQPDIFFILTEDICPNFGCYGDPNAKTPHIDEFAKDNIRFSYCSSAAPVCSAARTSLNLGMYGSCAGVGQHRSYTAVPPFVKNIGQYMKEAGYYTGIGKTDFNFIHSVPEGYDFNPETTYKDSEDFSNDFAQMIKQTDKPIFFIHTTACTHQSQYGQPQTAEEHRLSMPRLKEEEKQDRDSVKVPGYHFDSPESRELWAQYHEKMSTLDKMFGETIDTLKKADKYDDSIIFFVGDNGHGIPLGKCELWDEGVHVPFIMHVPESLQKGFELKEDKFGRYTDELVSFIDFAPTALDLAGAEIPSHMGGRVILGENKAGKLNEIYSFSERVDEVFENSRCIREEDMLLTCDFGYSTVRRPNMYQNITSPWFMKSMAEIGNEKNIPDADRRAFFRTIPRINEQMFNIKKDKSQFENLVLRENYADELVRMREKLLANIKKYNDGVFMPEPLSHEYIAKTGLTCYEIIRNDEYYPLERLIDLWRNCVSGKEITEIGNVTPAEKMMKIKFLADSGKLSLIEPLLNDESECVKALLAYRLGRKDILKDICEKTSNFYLDLYIADLIAIWADGTAVDILEVLIDRYWITKSYTTDERCVAAMNSAINMLCVKFDYHKMDEYILSSSWDEKSYHLAQVSGRMN